MKMQRPRPKHTLDLNRHRTVHENKEFLHDLSQPTAGRCTGTVSDLPIRSLAEFKNVYSLSPNRHRDRNIEKSNLEPFGSSNTLSRPTNLFGRIDAAQQFAGITRAKSDFHVHNLAKLVREDIPTNIVHHSPRQPVNSSPRKVICSFLDDQAHEGFLARLSDTYKQAWQREEDMVTHWRNTAVVSGDIVFSGIEDASSSSYVAQAASGWLDRHIQR